MILQELVVYALVAFIYISGSIAALWSILALFYWLCSDIIEHRLEMEIRKNEKSPHQR